MRLGSSSLHAVTVVVLIGLTSPAVAAWTTGGPLVGGSNSVSSVAAYAGGTNGSCTVYAGVGGPGGSVYKSTDNGTTWALLTGGPGNIVAVGIDPTDASIAYASSPSQVFKYSGGSWTLLTGTGSFTYRSLKPASNAVIYGAVNQNPGTVEKSLNGGGTWAPADGSGMQALPAQMGRRLAIVSPQTLFVGLTGDALGRSVYRTTDGGVSWTGPNPNQLPASLGTSSLAVDASSNPFVLYAGFNGAGVYKSTDGGVTWAAFNTNLPPSVDVRGLVVDPLSPSTVYAALSSGGVYKNDNSGSGWTNSGLTSGLPSNETLWDLAIDSNGLYLHAAGNLGVYDFQLRSGCCS